MSQDKRNQAHIKSSLQYRALAKIQKLLECDYITEKTRLIILDWQSQSVWH